MSEQSEQGDREALAGILVQRLTFGTGEDAEWNDAIAAGQAQDVIEAGFHRTPAPYDHPEGNVALVPLEWVLETYRDGDERGWDAEFEFLRREHSGQIDRLATSVQETGIQEPILLGSDGRVWDGHHRLCVASMLGLASVPVLLPTRSPAPQQVSTGECNCGYGGFHEPLNVNCRLYRPEGGESNE